MQEKVLFLLRKRPGKLWMSVSRVSAVILLIVVVLFSVGSGTGEAVPPTIPLTPELITVTVFSGSQVTLIWQDTSDNEDGFAVERQTGSGQFLEITTLGADVISFTDTTGLSETTYTYRIKAFNNAGASYSNERTITIMAAPSALTATGAAGTRVDLSWNDQTIYEDWYEIERKLPGGNYTVIASVDAGVTSVSDLSVSPGTTYYYRVRALNTWGYSSYSNEATANTLIGNPPAAPSDLNSTAAGKNSITLAWTDNAGNETGFRIERKITGGTFAEVATVGANVTTYINTGLASNTSYHYRIYAYNAAGNSAYSNEISAVTLPDVPAAPTNLKAGTLTKNSVSLSWTDNASNESGYKLERKTGTGTYSQIATFNANTTSYTNTNLAPNTTYTYRVRAYNATGNSTYSNELSVKTPAGDLPAAPTKLELSAVATDRIAITWLDNSSNEAGFKIERKTGTGSFIQIATVGANVTSLVNTGLKVNTQYTYRIRAYNTYGNSSYSNEISATTGNSPTAPSALKVIELTRSSIKISWTDNASTETGFKIERKTGSGSFTEVGTVGANTTTFTNTGLSANTTYTYRVRAYNASGNSAYSNEISAKPTDIPAAPTNLKISATTGNVVTLAWTDHASNETGFKIERKTGSGSYAEVATVNANTTSYTNSGLSANTTYHYRVRAYNAAGNSAYSNETSASITRETVRVNLTIGSTVYTVNQQTKSMDVSPIILDGRTLLPFRYVAEAIGADVRWDPTTKKVTVTLDNTVIELWIGNSTARVNGVDKRIDPANLSVKPIVVPPGRTMLPLRFIAENLGCDVEWNPQTKAVRITY